MKHKGKSQSKFFGNNKKKDRYVDASKQDDFIFNRTPILASALQKLKKNNGKNTSQLKRPAQSKLVEETKIRKKIKTNQPISSGPLLSFTPLQQDLYNFYNINKAAIKSIELIPQPKFEVGSTILTVIADRGSGGKYLVTHLFRNKKGYIDHKDISLSKNPQAIQSYQPGNFVVATVIKGSNPKSVQLSLNKFLDIDEKIFRIGQCLPAQIKSKQQVGCHLQIYGLNNYKAYLSKQDVDEEAFEKLSEKKQILCVIKQINHSAHLIKLGLSEEEVFFNLKGIQEQQMSRLQLDQYIAPGTLVNTKILKIVQNGIIVKFLKIFIGYIHVDHLEKQLNSYVVDDKIAARIVYYCVSPPTLYLSQKHVSLANNNPNRYLYFPVQKPVLVEHQHSMGIIKSINTKTINPIYLLVKGQLVKISVFDGIKPASIDGIEFIKNLKQYYSVGQKVPVYRKGNQYSLYPPQQLVDKDLCICRIVGFSNHYARVQTSNSKFLNCHITELTDLIVPYPFSEVKIGQLYLGRLLPNGTISLRSSIIQNGIPKSMKEYKQKFQGSQYQADYRNRLLAIGSAGLNVQDVVFGYVKSFSAKGVFVSINSEYDVRVQLSQLSDQYIQDKEKEFRPNKLVLMRLISEKVRPSEPNKKLFDASCRQSVVKHPLTYQALMVGLTVTGVVSGFTKGKALVRIDSSRYTGIIAQKDIEGINLDLPFQKQVKIGTHLKCKIIELKNDEGKQLIRLSTLKRVFEKYTGVQLEFQDDQRVFNLWNSFKEMDPVEPPKTEKQIIINQEQQQEQDEYARLNRLLAQGADQQSIQLQNQKQEQGYGQEAVDEQNYQNEQNDDEEEVDEEQNQLKEQIDPAHQSYPKDQLSKLMSQFEKMPHPPSFYQSLVLANPTSESYLMYISSLLPISTPQEIRSQFTRAIVSLTDIKDKDNLWISWLNTQIILGGFMTTVKKALQSDVGRDVYNRIVQILMQQQKWTVALEFSKKMLKKFNKDPKAYSLFIKSILKYSGQNNLPSRFSPGQVIKKAYQCLKTNDAITIQIQYGKSLFELNQNEKARNVFQNLITKYPKRTDIWNVYIDLQVKHGQLDRGRNLLQRALSMNLKKKRTITILKKYHQIQQKYGTPTTVENILKRAQTIASQGIDQQESQQQIAD